MKIPSIISSIGEKTVNLVRRTIPPKTGGLDHDIAEISTKIKLQNGIRKFLLGLDKKTIKQLEKLPAKEFLTESKKIIMKALDIPEEIAPQLRLIGKFSEPKIKMAYLPTLNNIIVPKATLEMNRAYLFSILRHEIEHFRQTVLILRTENLGDEAIIHYSERAKAQFSIDKFNDLQTLKNNIVEHYGVVGANSEEADRARNYFEEMKVSKAEITPDYNNRQIEDEAIDAQMPVFFEYLYKKFFG